MSQTKRIAQNTIILYVRMVVVLLITLFTSRIILKALGVEDFGLYNVVGGIVGLLTFFNGTMAKSTQRFLNVAMVKSNDSLSSIFASSITVHLMFAAFFLLLGETLGLWFLNSQVNIPEGRELAANIVYQASVLSFCVAIITIPYTAAIIAYEKMTFLAVVSIIQALLKLGIAVLLLHINLDKLSIYGILLLGVSIVDFLLYHTYCSKRYPILKFKISFDKNNFKQIFSFVSWTLVGQFSVVACNQGNVLLVNMYHSLVANAAMSVGSQINSAITNLTTNFQTAFNPQITKSYAEGNHDYLKTLVYTTSKISYCIMFVVALPVAFNIDWILRIWLEVVPSLSNTFSILFMVNGIINALSMPLNFTVLSSGRIKIFQIVTAIVFMLDIPITYFLFRNGFPPTTVLWVKIGVIVTILFVRLHFASVTVKAIDIKSYTKQVLLPIVLMSVIPASLAFFLNTNADSSMQRVLYTVIIEIICLAIMWLICFSKSERQSILTIVKKVTRN